MIVQTMRPRLEGWKWHSPPMLDVSDSGGRKLIDSGLPMSLEMRLTAEIDKDAFDDVQRFLHEWCNRGGADFEIDQPPKVEDKNAAAD